MYVCVCVCARAHARTSTQKRAYVQYSPSKSARPSARQRAAPAHGSTARVCVGQNLVRVYVRARLSCLPSLTHTHSLSFHSTEEHNYC